jgi:hypothetical protein
MSNADLQFCKKQLKGWKTHAGIHGATAEYFQNRIAATGIAVDIAVIAGLSAVTFGMAAKLGAALTATEGAAMATSRAAVGAVTVADSMAVGEAGAVLYRTDQVTRVFLGIAAGTTQRLSQEQLATSLAGLAARIFATTAVTSVATGVKLCLDGKPRSKQEVAWEMGKALMIAWTFSWLGAPGPKTQVQDRLIQRITKEAPHIVSEIGKLPSNQSLVMVYKLSDRTYKAIFSGEFDPPKVKKMMVQSGFNLNKAQSKVSAEVLKATKMWALESSIKLDQHVRKLYGEKDFDKEVPWYVDAAHSLREAVTGDSSVASGLKKTTTELAVAVNQVRFWDAVVKEMEAMSSALAAANPAGAK